METKMMKKGEKLIFGWGDVFGGGAQALIGVIYVYFLIAIIGIHPAIAGTIVLLARVVDAITDPLMGVFSDNTRTKFGRRRPYIFVGGLLILIVFALMWMPVGGWKSEFAIIIYAGVTYILYSVIATVIAVPYSSLSAEITTNVRERNTVNIIRLIFSTVATAVCTLIPTFVLEMFDDGIIAIETFYLIIGVGFGLFFALPLIMVALFTKERAPIPTRKSVFKVEQFVKPLKVKSFRGLIYMYLCQSISMDILAMGIVFYAKFVLFGSSSTVFLGTFIGVQLLLFPLINYLVNKIDKKKIYYFGLPLAIFSFIFVGFYPKDMPILYAYILTGLTALGFAGAQLMSWIIFPDTVDVGELKYNERATGSYSGIMTFIRKVSSAIAIQIFTIVLATTGFDRTAVSQPDGAILGIRIAMTFSFVILMTVGFFVARRFVLTNERSELVRKHLKLREDNAILSVQEVEEFKYIEKVLF